MPNSGFYALSTRAFQDDVELSAASSERLLRCLTVKAVFVEGNEGNCRAGGNGVIGRLHPYEVLAPQFQVVGRFLMHEYLHHRYVELCRLKPLLKHNRIGYRRSYANAGWPEESTVATESAWALLLPPSTARLG
jgi:hypothetical protein